eukprot:s325_g20.t1
MSKPLCQDVLRVKSPWEQTFVPKIVRLPRRETRRPPGAGPATYLSRTAPGPALPWHALEDPLRAELYRQADHFYEPAELMSVPWVAGHTKECSSHMIFGKFCHHHHPMLPKRAEQYVLKLKLHLAALAAAASHSRGEVAQLPVWRWSVCERPPEQSCDRPTSGMWRANIAGSEPVASWIELEVRSESEFEPGSMIVSASECTDSRSSMDPASAESRGRRAPVKADLNGRWID